MEQTRNKSSNIRKLSVGLLALVILVSMFLIAGCGSNRDEALVGTWSFELDSSWVTTFNADGTGTHSLDWGFGTSFRWSTLGGNITWNYYGHPRMITPYNISGNALYITMDDGTVYRYIKN